MRLPSRNSNYLQHNRHDVKSREVVCAAHSLARGPEEEPVGPGDLYGWLNVNQPGDFNKLHMHESHERWSGSFYLQVRTPKACLVSQMTECLPFHM